MSLNVKVTRLGRQTKSGVNSTVIRARLEGATKKGVELIGRAIRDQAKDNAQKTIRHSNPYNRPHRGGSADRSYFDSFRMEMKGSRGKWVAEIWNAAKDQHIQEGGRARGASRPNMKNAATRRKIRGWAQDRGLLSGTLFERGQRRGKSGRFLAKRRLSEKQVLFAICKAIGRKGRTAHRNLTRAGLKVQQDTRRANTQFVRLLEGALR